MACALCFIRGSYGLTLAAGEAGGLDAGPTDEVIVNVPVATPDDEMLWADPVACGAPRPGPVPVPPKGLPPSAPIFTSPNEFVAAILNDGSLIEAICCCQSAATVWSVKTS